MQCAILRIVGNRYGIGQAHMVPSLSSDNHSIAFWQSLSEHQEQAEQQVMPQVSLTLNGRVYRFVCEPGEEDHFLTLAHYLQAKVETVRSQFGKVGDERILAMAALLVTDELFEARAQVADTAPVQHRMSVPKAPRARPPVRNTAPAAPPVPDVVPASEPQSPADVTPSSDTVER
jgi:cell division protein ZapA (FtsZ GTPase activity inhibitor)